MNAFLRIVSFFCISLGILAAGCGYSQSEWQAQLDKYAHLKSEDDARIAEAQRKVTDLTKQLQDMGVEVSSTKADLAERQKALDEYKDRARQLELIKARFEKLKG
jgi:chemotaxis protein MotB